MGHFSVADVCRTRLKLCDKLSDKTLHRFSVPLILRPRTRRSEGASWCIGIEGSLCTYSIIHDNLGSTQSSNCLRDSKQPCWCHQTALRPGAVVPRRRRMPAPRMVPHGGTAACFLACRPKTHGQLPVPLQYGGVMFGNDDPDARNTKHALIEPQYAILSQTLSPRESAGAAATCKA